METREVATELRSPDGIEQAALKMAMAILVERIKSLPQDDRDDMYELAKELAKADKCEERESVVAAMIEILEQKPVRVKPCDKMFEGEPSSGMKRWLAFISERIRTLRKAKGLTQEELAAKSGLPQSHISRLEGAKHSPSNLTLRKLAKALGVPIGELDPSS